jgi:hypothetical protein
MIVLTIAGVLLLSASGPVRAQSTEVRGTSGYLSEWDLSGRVTMTSERNGRSLAGMLTMTHTGLCSPEGPVEKTAEFRARIIGARPSARIEGAIVLEGAVCTFGGPLAGRFGGSMDCPDAKGVPVTLTIQ